jgi:hypothetical protein
MTKILLVTPVIAILLVAIPVVAYAQYTTSNGTLLCNVAICDTQGFRDLGGAFNKVTGYSYNELGVFIPWTKLCDKGQSYLIESCSNLVDPSTDSLTKEGDKAVNCIIHGIAYGSKLNGVLGISLAKTLLNLGASLTGCGGIVDIHVIFRQTSELFKTTSR